jgi:hypothetical protein
MLKLHRYVMVDLYFAAGCFAMGELARLIHRIRADSL